jgi:folate-binding protein YgfZ
MQLNRLLISGSDSSAFLQRQLTADLDSFAEGEQRLTAWCNIQGRVLCLFWLTKTATQWVLDVPTDNYRQLMPRLKMFVLRDDVQISEPQNYSASIDTSGKLADIAGDESSRIHLIENGIPYLESGACEAYLPQMLNLDLLQGLSFSKGCYPGQEIVARTHFRGKLKQRMLRLESKASVGDSLYAADDSKAGTVILSADGQCLAVVRLEKLTNGLKDSDGKAARMLELPYAIPELVKE